MAGPLGGAPIGNQNAAKGRQWSLAIERIIACWPDMPPEDEYSSYVNGLNKAAHAFISKMRTSDDLGFYREFGDRMDGKAIQQIDATVEANLTVEVVRFAELPVKESK